MNPSHHTQQQQQQMMMWLSHQQRVFTSTSDCDRRHWDATMELLATMNDPAVAESDGSRWPGAVSVTVQSGVDFSKSESLREEDVGFIVSDTNGRTTELLAPPTIPVDRETRAAPFTTTAALPTEKTTSAGGRSVPSKTAPQVNAPAKLALMLSKTAEAAKAMLSPAEQARRERNRLKVRRLYYRKLERLTVLRTQATDLEEKLEDLKTAQSDASEDSTELTIVTKHTQPTSSTSSVKYAKLLQELARTKQRLQHENEYLRHVVSQYLRSVHSVSATLLELREPVTAYLKFKSMTRQDCAELRRRTLSQAGSFARSKAHFRVAGTACGWRSMHLVQERVYQFCLEKILPNISAAHVAQLVWSVLSDPDQFVRMYSQAVGMKCYMLQKLDADNVVLFQEAQSMNPLEERPVVVRTVQLISRIPTSSGVVIVQTSLDRDNWLLDDQSRHQDSVVWNDHSSWQHYTDVPNSSDCACVVAGYVPVVGENVRFWMVELVRLVVRCESLLLGPASYSLQSTTPTDEDDTN